MEPQHRKLIQSNYRALAKQLGTDIEEVCFSLYEKNILNEAMKQGVMAERTPSEQTYELLDIIVRRGPKAFAMLYEACKEQDLFQACDILMPCNAPHEPEEESLSSDELMGDSTNTQPEEDVDPWLEPDTDTYCSNLQSRVLKCKKVVSETLYRKHIDNNGYYQMTKSKQGRMFLLFDGKTHVSHLDRMILDHFCNEFNFKSLIVKSIKKQTDLKIPLDCSILMIFVMASGQHGFFNRDRNSGLKCLKTILKEDSRLANIPKLIFHMTLGSDEADPDANGGDFVKGGKPEAKGENGLKNDSATGANGATPGTEEGQERVDPDDNTETPRYSKGSESGSLVTMKKKKPEQEFDQDQDLHDGLVGTAGLKIPKDSDFFHIEVSKYGCELLDKKIIRFFHLIVDVFFKNAYTMEFLDLIRHANKQQMVVKLQSTGRRKLYFFPGCNNDV